MFIDKRKSLRSETGLAEEVIECLKGKTINSLPVTRLENTANDFKIINDEKFTRLVKDKSIAGDITGLKLKEILSYRPVKNYDEKVRQVSYSDTYPVLGNLQYTKAVCFRFLKPCKYYATLYITINTEDNTVRGVYYTESYTSTHNKNMIATENVYNDIEYIVQKLLKYTHY